MAQLLNIEVKESVDELKTVLSKCTHAQKPRIRMLLLIVSGTTSSQDLASATKANRDSIRNWKNTYVSKGIGGLVSEERGRACSGRITAELKETIRLRLSDPKDGFTSYKDAIAWINEVGGLQLRYSNANPYLKRHFGTKLKVGRKSHVKKDDMAAALFKKTA